MKARFYIGILLFLLSYLQLFLPSFLANLWALTLLNIFFMTGVILICEGITLKIYNKSLLNIIIQDKQKLFTFIAVSVLGGLLLDSVAQWLGKLWFYPYYNVVIYALFFIGGFALYWLMIVESYLAVKSLLDLLRKGRKRVTKYYKFENVFYKILGAVSIILILFGVFLILNNYINQGGYVFNISEPDLYKVNFGYIMLIFLGVWFLLEFVEYSFRKTSLLKDIFHSYFIPFLSIIFVSFILAIVMETQNLIYDYWIYLNWPFSDIKLFSLPLSMFLAWPLHYIVFLSLFRASTGELSEVIWSGDKIK